MSKSTKKPPTKGKKAKKSSKRPATVVAKAQAETTTERRGKGRPTSYRDEYADQVRKLHLLGVTEQEMADFFGVSIQTLYNWRAQHPDFVEAERGARVFADAEVAASAHKRATGYSYETEKVVGKGDDKKVVKVTVHVPADATAAQWWLRNRRRSNWADTKQVEVGGPGDFDQMSIEELQAFLAEDDASKLFGATRGSDSIN